MVWKRVTRWAIVGAIPGLAFLTWSVPVEPEVDLLIGVGGIVLAVIGAAIGAIAAREPDAAARYRMVARAAAGAVIGAGLFFVQPILGVLVMLVGTFLGLGWERFNGPRSLSPGR